MTALQRALVDDLGNINVHGRQGLSLVVMVETATPGEYENIAGWDIVFEVSRKFQVALGAGPDVKRRVLVLSQAQVAKLPLDQGVEFALLDRTTAVPAPLWRGVITASGFREAPPSSTPAEGTATTWSGGNIIVRQDANGQPTIVVRYEGATGRGVPAGGEVGDVLRKASTDDYDAAWDALGIDDIGGLATSLSGLASGDVSLTERLSTEEGARAAADTSLETRLSTEEATRNSADTSLTSRVGAVESGYLPLSGGVLTGALRVIAGTVLAVGLAVGADAGTGLYSPASQQVGIAAGGTHVATFEAGIATVAGVVKPDADATRDLGTVSARWRVAYAQTHAFDANNYFSTSGGFIHARINGADRVAFGPSNQLQLRSDGSLGWTSGTSPTTTPDLFLYRDGAGALAQRNGTSAQAFRVYNTWANGGADTEYGQLAWQSNEWRIGTVRTGTGSGRPVAFQTNGTSRWVLQDSYFAPAADATYDLASSSARVRDGWFSRTGYFGTSLSVGSTSTFTLRDGLGNTFVPTMANMPTSGVAAVMVGVVDGVNNRRAGLFVDATNLIWGLNYNFSSGSSEFVITHALAELLRLSPVGVMTVRGNVLAGTDATFDLGQSAASRFRDAFFSRNLTAGTGVSAGTYLRVNGTNAGYIALGTADDVILVRDGAANTLALRNGTNAQTFRAYETYTDASNYSRFGITFSGSTWAIGPEAAGTGSARAVAILSGGNLTLYGGGSAQWQISGGNFLAVADNTRDIGAAGATRPRSGYFGTSVVVGTNPTGVASALGAFGQSWALLGGDVATDATNKAMRLGSAHYTNAEEPVTLLFSYATSAGSGVYIGGGSSAGNAATEIGFYTAANTTTTTGTLRWLINNSGHLITGADGVGNIGAPTTGRPNNAYVSTSIEIGGSAPSGSAALTSFGRTWAMLGCRTALTDATTKAMQIGVPHYTNAEEPMLLIGGTVSSTAGQVYIGGNSGSGNAATEIAFYTAADNVTVTGTKRLSIDSGGHLMPGADATYKLGDNALQFIDAYISRSVLISQAAIPAGGVAGRGLRFSSTANFGIFFGSGAPTLSAAKGSIYLRSDGSGTNDRVYVNTDGGTTWTAMVTVA